MKALTLKQPWAWAVAHAGKDVENRTWKPPQSVIGQRIAIHAGKAWDHDGDLTLCRLVDGPYLQGPGTVTYGAIVAVATVKGVVFGGIAWFYHWFTGGPYGWFLTDVIALPEPIPCKGAQGLWNVPADIEAEIDRQAKFVDILNSVDAGKRAKRGEVKV